MQSMTDKAEDTDFTPVNDALDNQVNQKMLQELAFAETIQDKQEILDSYDSDLTVPQADLQVLAMMESEQQTFNKINELQSQEQLELSQVEDLAERALSEPVIRESVGEFAEIESVGENKYKVVGRGGAEYNIDIIPDLDFQNEYGADKGGVWDSKAKTITFPDTA